MRKVTGVSLDAKTVQISVVERMMGTERPVKSDLRQLPEDTEKRPLFVKDSFEYVATEYHPDGIVLSLAADLFMFHFPELPLVKKSEIRDALPYELEKYLPLPVDEYIFDYAILSQGPDRTKLLAVSVKREQLKSLLDIVSGLGMNIIAVRCSVIEAFKEFIMDVKVRNIQGIFINCMDSAFEIVGFRDSMPVLCRTLRNDRDLVRETEALLPLFPDGVFITGKTDALIAEKLNARTVPLSLAYVIASNAEKRHSLSLNFLPPELRRKKTDYYPYLLGGTAAATLLLFFLTAPLSYYKAQKTLGSIEERIQTIKKQASGIIELKRNLESVQTDRKFLAEIKIKSNIPQKVIRALSDMLPKNTWLTSLSVDDKGRIEMEGFTKKASELVLLLENSGFFKNVYLSEPINIREGEDEKFSIKMEAAGI
jgi:Tfp pilus assembly protein PilN